VTGSRHWLLCLTLVKPELTLVVMRTLGEIQEEAAELVSGLSGRALERRMRELVSEAYEVGQHQRPSAYISYPAKPPADQYGAAAGYSGAI